MICFVSLNLLIHLFIRVFDHSISHVVASNYKVLFNCLQGLVKRDKINIENNCLLHRLTLFAWFIFHVSPRTFVSAEKENSSPV